MKKFFEELSEWLWIIGVLLFVFLFYGEPDVWDRLHELAMGTQPKCVSEPTMAEKS